MSRILKKKKDTGIKSIGLRGIFLIIWYALFLEDGEKVLLGKGFSLSNEY